MNFRLPANLLFSRTGVSLLRRLTSSQAWYRDVNEEKLHEPHATSPAQYLSPEEVFKRSGVIIKKVTKSDAAEVAKLKKEGCFNYLDLLVLSRSNLSNFENKMQTYYSEHMHTDDEVRLISEGSGFFEFRDKEDKWIRVHVKQGDLIHLPAGLYQRLTLDCGEYVKMHRLFNHSEQWRSIDRPQGDCHPVRKAYLQTLQACEN